MITSFCEVLATELKEIEVPVFIENLSYWIRKNAANNKHFHEGRYWSYNSYPAFAKLYPYWSEQTIRRIIKRAVAFGLLIIGNFNNKKYDNTNWYTLSDKGLAYYPALHGLILNTPVGIDSTPVEIDRPIPKDLNSLSNYIIISDLENKSDYSGNCELGDLGSEIGITSTESSTKSDYHKNQTKKETGLTKKEQNNAGMYSNNGHSVKSIGINDIIIAYHEVLPECPKIKVVDSKLRNQLIHMVKNWPRYQKEGRAFTIESFKDYLNYIKQHYAWFITPYTTANGNVRRNNLRVLTREVNITKIVNGEFSAN